MTCDRQPVPMIEELSAGFVPPFDPAQLSPGEGVVPRGLVAALLLAWLAVFALAPAAFDPSVATARAVKDLAGTGKKAAAGTDSSLRRELVKEWQ
jgi:hypothetical protein